jgi:hypothetical protein
MLDNDLLFTEICRDIILQDVTTMSTEKKKEQTLISLILSITLDNSNFELQESITKKNHKKKTTNRLDVDSGIYDKCSDKQDRYECN